MKSKNTFSATVKPSKTGSALSSLAGRWNPEVAVEVTWLSEFTRGPITIIPPSTKVILPPEVPPDTDVPR
jgi:hypothetical protein